MGSTCSSVVTDTHRASHPPLGCGLAQTANGGVASPQVLCCEPQSTVVPAPIAVAPSKGARPMIEGARAPAGVRRPMKLVASTFASIVPSKPSGLGDEPAFPAPPTDSPLPAVNLLHVSAQHPVEGHDAGSPNTAMNWSMMNESQARREAALVESVSSSALASGSRGV